MLQEGHLLQGRSGRDCQSWDLNSGSQKGVSLRCSLHGEFSFLLYTALGGQGCPIIKTDQRRYDIYFPSSRKMLSIPPGILQHPLASCCKMRVWETVNYNLNTEDILKWKWGRKFGRGGRKIMKSSSAVSLGRRILLEGEFKGFGKGKMVRWKAGFLSSEPGGKKRGRQSWCDAYVDGGLWAWEEERFLMQISSLGTEHIGGSR